MSDSRMKLLIDQGLPRSTTALLHAYDLDAVHVAEADLMARVQGEIKTLLEAIKAKVVEV